MSTSAGSVTFVLSALLFICCSVLLLLRYYLPLRTTPAYLLVPVFLALALPVSLIVLVPIDLASSLREDGQSAGIWLPETAILVAWRVAYWLTFALTWFILPLLGEYLDSGYRTPRDRTIYSLKSNGRYYLIALGCGGLGLVYILWQNGFHGASVKSLVMALAYCVGLIQAVLLLGHGLVAIPRHMFRNAGARLKRLQTRAPKIHEKLDDATVALQDLNRQLEQLRTRKTGVSKDMEDWIEELGESGPHTITIPSATLPSTRPTSNVPAVITDRYLADLGRRLMRSRHKVYRFTYTWDRLVQEAADTQAIIDSTATKRLEFQKDSTQPKLLQIPLVTPYIRYLLYCRVSPVLRVVCGVVFGLASLSIIWSELVKFIAPKISIVSLTVVRYSSENEGKVGFGGQMLSFLWILYMCTCTLASLGDIKVWGNRALVRRNTYGESACWFSCQVAKLTVPLTYNFLTFIPPAVHEKTTFYAFLGKLINLTPLGTGFDYFFPMLILIPACATLFNVYGRIKKVLGFGIIDDEDEESSPFGGGGWREGRDLIERELQGRPHFNAAALSNQAYSDGTDDEPAAPSSNLPSSRTPTSYVPPQGTPSRPQTQAQRLSAATQAAEEEDESIFSGFAHRFRNTLDNVERPDWLPEFGKRPKWMGGQDAESPGEIQGERPREGSRRPGIGVGRLFRGRTASGRIRL
ncbi:hypothetical protein MMC10_003819 [Thelotrema lepadinum]|nr:hypothetical protein [Thelotrema lepadinum]